MKRANKRRQSYVALSFGNDVEGEEVAIYSFTIHAVFIQDLQEIWKQTTLVIADIQRTVIPTYSVSAASHGSK